MGSRILTTSTLRRRYGIALMNVVTKTEEMLRTVPSSKGTILIIPQPLAAARHAVLRFRKAESALAERTAELAAHAAHRAKK